MDIKSFQNNSQVYLHTPNVANEWLDNRSNKTDKKINNEIIIKSIQQIH